MLGSTSLLSMSLANTALDRIKYLDNSCTILYTKGVYNVANHKYYPPKTPLDKHHLCFIGRRWNVGYLCDFRRFWYCRVYIPRDSLHRYIHENLATIPTPKPQNAKLALEQLRTLERYGAIHNEDSIERRLEVIIALFECNEQRTADAFRKQLELVHEYKGLSS